MGEVVSSAMDFALSPFETGMDSLGISRHGRDMVHQEHMAREQMDWQSSENQKNRDFSQQMYEQQLQDYLKNYPELLKQQADTQFGVWSKQFAAENAFNNPAAQLARMRGAGQNPVGSDGLTVGNNSMSGGSSIAPPPQIHGSPLGGSASPVGIPQGMSGELMRDFGSLVKNLSDSRVNEKTMGKLEAEVEKLLSEKELNDSLKSYQEIKNGIIQVFGFKRESLELQRMLRDSRKLESEGDYFAAASLNQKALARLNNSEAAINEEKKPFIAKLMQKDIERLVAEIRNQNAQAAEALSRKELNNANKELTDIAIKVKNAESSPDILTKKAETILSQLERDKVISAKEMQEANRRIEQLKGITKYRHAGGILTEAIDDLVTWWTSHISVALTGSASVSQSSGNHSSSVKYE